MYYSIQVECLHANVRPESLGLGLISEMNNSFIMTGPEEGQ